MEKIIAQKRVPKPPSEIIIFSILLAWNGGKFDALSLWNKFISLDSRAESAFLNFSTNDNSQNFPINLKNVLKTKHEFINFRNDDLDTFISRSDLIKNSYNILHIFGWVKRYPEFFKDSSSKEIYWRGNFSILFTSCLKKLRSINILDVAGRKNGFYKLSYKIEDDTIINMISYLDIKNSKQNVFKLTKPYSFKDVEYNALDREFWRNIANEIVKRYDSTSRGFFYSGDLVDEIQHHLENNTAIPQRYKPNRKFNMKVIIAEIERDETFNKRIKVGEIVKECQKNIKEKKLILDEKYKALI